MIAVIVTRDVSAEESHNFSGRAVKKGETLYTFDLTTYGCVDEIDGIALSEGPKKYPFFEFPRDAVTSKDDDK